MSTPSSTKAILYALGANTTIAIIKTGTALWTGSGSMMAEAIHSFADCGNQILLFIGMKRSSLPASEKHPMGYDREAYIWSMMVALLLFSVGGLFSFYEGVHRYLHPQPVDHLGLAIVILIFAFGLEAFSLRGALEALKDEKGDKTMWQWFQETHSSELMVVLGEDLAALAGLGIALVTTILVAITGNVVFDAIGSALIGTLLIAVSYVVAKEVHSLLLGEADPKIRDAIQSFLEEHIHIDRVFNIFAIHHGHYVMVAVKAELPATLLVHEATGIINEIEREIKTRHPRVKWVFFEIDQED